MIFPPAPSFAATESQQAGPKQLQQDTEVIKHTAAGAIESTRFTLNGFTYYFTFFSKFFSSFPHGTCSLSVSPKYLDLDGYYHPFVLQSQATRLIDSHPETDTNSLNGVVTLYDTKSKKDLNELMLKGNGHRPHVPLASQGIKGLI